MYFLKENDIISKNKFLRAVQFFSLFFGKSLKFIKKSIWSLDSYYFRKMIQILFFSELKIGHKKNFGKKIEKFSVFCVKSILIDRIRIKLWLLLSLCYNYNYHYHHLSNSNSNQSINIFMVVIVIKLSLLSSFSSSSFSFTSFSSSQF